MTRPSLLNPWSSAKVSAGWAEKQEDVFYYLTLMNENYAHPPIPEGDRIKEEILSACTGSRRRKTGRPELRAHLTSCGAILTEALKAQALLAAEYSVAADVGSVTSYKELYRDGNEVDRLELISTRRKNPRKPYITECVAGDDVVFVAATDYVKALPDSISQWLPGRLISLGTESLAGATAEPRCATFLKSITGSLPWRRLSLSRASGRSKPKLSPRRCAIWRSILTRRIPD